VLLVVNAFTVVHSTPRTRASFSRKQQQQQQQQGISPSSTSNAAAAATGGMETTAATSFDDEKTTTAADAAVMRNMFHDYHKPILLLGVSSDAGLELQRLAGRKGGSSSILAGRVINNDDPATTTTSQDVLVDGDDWLSSLTSRDDYCWPNIILLDFATIPAAASKQQEDKYIDMARCLYQDAGLLSIYINVQPTDATTQMSAAARALKQRLEQDVFVAYTDYELCIRDEGFLSPPPSSSPLQSNMDLDNDDDDGTIHEWSHVEWELARLLARARLVPAVPGDGSRSSNTAHLTMGQHTFFLSLTFPDVTQAEQYIPTMCLDVDAMEYRTDLLACRDSRFDLLYGMQLLRRYCRPHTVRVPLLPGTTAVKSNSNMAVLEDVMPIVYTVRTQHQAGTFPDDEEQGIPRMFEMLKWGLRAGVEVLDVESAWNVELTSDLLHVAQTRYASQILGSHHVVGQEISLEEAIVLFENCALQGRAHGAKVVLSIESEERDRMAYEAALIATELAAQSHGETPVIPNISLILGDIGKFSRIINLPFTPVTHESLPSKAAPGQLTAMEIMTTRLLTQIFAPKKYCILGHNIAYSVSPQMHGAAFMATKLPHTYVRADVATVEEFVASDFFNAHDFGGASVTIPHKQAIIPFVDVLSDAAKTIGSVNTLVVKQEFVDDDFKRVVYGDNTDWKGMYNPLERLLGGIISTTKRSSGGGGTTTTPTRNYALILGAGGTARAAAFVANKLGLQPVYYNRTPAKALELAETFGGVVVGSLVEEQNNSQADDSSSAKTNEEFPSLGALLARDHGGRRGRVRVVISTLPAGANFELPEWLLAKDENGDDDKLLQLPIVFDVNYKPFNTKLLLQAEAAGCKVVRGSEMLWEQGVGQFELWTERTAPYAVMKRVVLDNCVEAIVATTATDD
jgi:shikimate dehydrogenase/3-dehydroquinate dehydratase type I